MTTEYFKETELGLVLNDWDLEELNSLCKITSSKRIFHKDYVDNGIPFYRSKEIILRANNSPIKDHLYISEDKYSDILNKYGVPNDGDLLMTSVGTLGIPYIVQPDDKFYFKDGNLMWFRSFSKRLYNKYLYYWVLSPAFQQKLDTVSIGSTQKALTINSLKKIEIPIPPFDEQIEIVKILSDLDSKIILNQKMNQTLEEIGQAIFKHWFVHFEFPNDEGKPYKSSGGVMVDSELGEIPKGWEIKKLGDVCNIIMGQSPKSEFYNENGEGLPFHQGVTNFGERFPKDKMYCTVENKIAEKGDILFSVRAPVGRINISNSKMVIGRGLCAIRHKNNLQSFILYQLKNIFTEEDSIGSGTVFNAITRRELDDLLVVFPNFEVSSEFNVLFDSIDKEIENLTLQNNHLSKIRDSLLPKLMSGKIRVL